MRGRARCEGEVADARVQREEDDLRGREVVPEHPGYLEPGHTRHGVVEHDQVGAELEGLPCRLDAISGLAHDLEVGIGVDERPKALAHGEVVVGDEDSLWHE